MKQSLPPSSAHVRSWCLVLRTNSDFQTRHLARLNTARLFAILLILVRQLPSGNMTNNFGPSGTTTEQASPGTSPGGTNFLSACIQCKSRKISAPASVSCKPSRRPHHIQMMFAPSDHKRNNWTCIHYKIRLLVTKYLIT